MAENPVMWATKMENPPLVTVKKLQNPPVKVREKKPSISFESESDDDLFPGLSKENSKKYSKFIDDFSFRAKINLVDRKNPKAVRKKAKELADFFVEKLKKNEVGKRFTWDKLDNFFISYINSEKLQEE